MIRPKKSRLFHDGLTLYKIDFLLDDKQINILLDLKKMIKTKLIVNVFVNEIAEKSFISVSSEDNEKIVKEILK